MSDKTANGDASGSGFKSDVYRALVENSLDAILMTAPDGAILYANPAACALFQMTEAEIIKGGRTAIADLEDPRLSLALEKRQRTGRFAGELNYKKADGTVFPAYVSSVIFRDAGGELRSSMIVRDITEKQRAEGDLKKSRERFQSILRAAPAGIGVVQDRRFMEVNRQLCEMTGYDEAELIGRSARMFYESLPEFERVGREKYQEMLEKGTGVIETRWRKKDGKVMDVLLSSTYLNFDDLSDGAVFASLDITDRKRAEVEREKLQTQLFQARKMEAAGRLAGGIAHDFNNMLSVILGYAEMTMEQMDPKDPLYANLSEIHMAGMRSREITRQLLGFARKQTIYPQMLSLNDAVEGILKVIRRLIDENIEFVWRPGHGIWPVRMDPAQLDQILATLCINARDAIAGSGKIVIETQNTTFSGLEPAMSPECRPGNFVMLSVADTGCGMDAETRGNLFEPFFTAMGIGKGTGLGLATIYGIVQQNKGFIQVAAEPGKGSVFQLYFPRHDGGSEPAAAETGAWKPAPGGGKTILLVEDDPHLRKMGRAMLERLGYHALTASSPAEALDEANRYAATLHLLITDVILPGMNGKELAAKLRELHPDLQVLFLSGYTDDAIAQQGVLGKDVHFLHKPFSLKDLHHGVQKVLINRED